MCESSGKITWSMNADPRQSVSFLPEGELMATVGTETLNTRVVCWYTLTSESEVRAYPVGCVR
jgi:hypothetical protein